MAKEAAHIAVSYLSELYDDPKSLQDVLIEEIERSDDGRYWYVTLGYTRPKLFDFFGARPLPREYKVFEIESATREVKSMKIRKP